MNPILILLALGGTITLVVVYITFGKSIILSLGELSTAMHAEAVQKSQNVKADYLKSEEEKILEKNKEDVVKSVSKTASSLSPLSPSFEEVKYTPMAIGELYDSSNKMIVNRIQDIIMPITISYEAILDYPLASHFMTGRNAIRCLNYWDFGSNVYPWSALSARNEMAHSLGFRRTRNVMQHFYDFNKLDMNRLLEAVRKLGYKTIEDFIAANTNVTA